MYRSLLEELKNWKNKPTRKPILLDGARQTGKTYLLQTLFSQEFEQIFRIDFLEQPDLESAFSGSLTPKDILNNLELLTNQTINPLNTLIIFDEVGECERAVQSLKFFAEQAPEYFIVASGSNIGLLQSFPVGKVEQLSLTPLSFYEFLLASNEQALIKAFDELVDNDAVHLKMLEKLTDYYFVGGMPEAVKAWYDKNNSSLLQKISAVTQVHQDLIQGYQRDFGKYAGKVNANLIEAVFNSVPRQLFAVQDESVKRFRFKDIYEKKSRYAEFETSIGWLEKSRLVLKNYPIEGQPKVPLAAYAKPNYVKLFMFDTGLLTSMLGLTYQEIKQDAFEYKGFIAENFVQQELASLSITPTYSWYETTAEIEFILSDGEGNIIPLEVKSGKRTKSKSLTSFINRYNPAKTLKLTGTRSSPLTEQTNLVRPIYYTSKILNSLIK